MFFFFLLDQDFLVTSHFIFGKTITVKNIVRNLKYNVRKLSSQMRVREWKYCGRWHAESIAVPPWIFEVTNRETLFTASRIAKFRILISFRSGATRAKGDLMNSLDLGEMWRMVRRLSRCSRSTEICGSVMYRLSL